MWTAELRASALIAVYKSMSNDAAPKWILHDLEKANLPSSIWNKFRSKVMALAENQQSIEQIVDTAVKASFNKKIKSKSVAPFLQAILTGQKIEVECLGRAKSVAAVAEALHIPVTVLGNETHLFVKRRDTNDVLDFKTNMKYRNELAKRGRAPYYYEATTPLDSSGIIATTVLNDSTSDAEAMRIIEKLYPGEALAQAPVWARVFVYESDPMLVLADEEALLQPFVALDFAKKLKMPGLMEVALANLNCGRYEYDKEFFYNNDGDTTFLGTLEQFLKDSAIDVNVAKQLLEASILRASECMSSDRAHSYKERCNTLKAQYGLLSAKRARRE